MSLIPTNCTYGGKTTLTYDSGEVDVYIYITGGDIAPTLELPYATALGAKTSSSSPTQLELDPEAYWGKPVTGAEIYLQQVVDGRYKNLEPGTYALNIVNSGFELVVPPISFTVDAIPFTLDEETMTLTNGGVDISGVYIILQPTSGTSFSYPLPAWNGKYTYESPYMDPTALWTNSNLPYSQDISNGDAIPIYLEQPPGNNSAFFTYLSADNNPYTLQITDFLKIYYEKNDLELGTPDITVGLPTNGTMVLTVSGFPQIGYVSIQTGMTLDVSGNDVIDWGQVVDSNTVTGLKPLRNRQFFKTGQPITLELVQVKDLDSTVDKVYPYTPGNYYVRLTDFRSFVKYSNFTVPQPTIVTGTIGSESITFTTTGIRNGMPVNLMFNSYSAQFAQTVSDGTLQGTFPDSLVSSTLTTPLPFTVFLKETFTGGNTFPTLGDSTTTDTTTFETTGFVIPFPAPQITGVSSSYPYNESITYTNTGTDDVYLVIYNNNTTYYFNYETTTITLDVNALYSNLIDNSTTLLSDLYAEGTCYLACVGKVSNTFIITDGTQSNISLQWKTVYEDNMALMKAGLYNTSSVNNYFYSYFPSPEPQDISSNGIAPNTPLPPSTSDPTQSSSTDRIELSISNNTLTYNSSTDNLGINNGEYFLNLIHYIRIDNHNITLSGGDAQDVLIETPTDIPSATGTFTVINSDDNGVHQYVAKSTILEIVPSAQPFYYYVDLICTLPDYVGSPPNGNPYPGNKNPYMNLYMNIGTDAKADGNLFDGFGQIFFVDVDGYNANPIGVGGSEYPITLVNTNLVVRLSPSDGNRGTVYPYVPVDPYKHSDNDISLQWGGPGTNTVDVFFREKKVKGICSMLVNIPSTGPYTADIYDENDTLLSNKFVVSSECVFINPYVPPSIPLDTIRYGDLNGLSNKNYYLPTMIPGGDYLNVNTNGTLSVTFMGGSQPNMTADRCRQPWRLSHYVRSNEAKDSAVMKIAYNTAAALVYNASLDLAYTPSKPGRLTLNVNTCNLSNAYDGYSGDMVPPLLALIDALEMNNYPDLELAITGYSTAIKDLGKELTIGQLISSLTTGAPNAQSEIYPLLDSMGSGGQQLGLAGCGFICTKDFLARDNFNIMLKYDAITGWSASGVLSTPPTPYFGNEHFDNLIQVYKMSASRGNGFEPFATWALSNTIPNPANDNKNYANLILSKAYLTNLRIRDVNVKIEDELTFGPNFQGTQFEDGKHHNCYLFYDDGSGPSVDGSSYVASINYNHIDPPVPTSGNPAYVYTDFPMYGIPDSGWGSLTVEIFSYLGIVYVGMNDYTNFCKWHRTFWHLLFIQNGGNMYDWSASTVDKIPLTNPAVTKVDPATFWLPSYNRPNADNENWVNQVLNKKQLHSFDVYKFPPENYYTTATDVTNCTTDYWANRYNPYRGNSSETSHVAWTTPSYCMGYSPAWVAGGKTDTTGFDDNNINRPIAEALNPMFTNTAGLYSATDGDENILQAYILASLQWPATPPIPTASNSYEITQPICPTAVNSTGVHGYDCDVSDFNANTDIPVENSNPKGVKYAAGIHPTVLNPITGNDLYVTDKIGYGITTTDGVTWEYPTVEGERCTTWAYIAKAIQRTIISQNGNGWGEGFGNFTSLEGFPSSSATDGGRFETLGHDTSASAGTTKLDYIDLRLYQVCETVTFDVENA